MRIFSTLSLIAVATQAVIAARPGAAATLDLQAQLRRVDRDVEDWADAVREEVGNIERAAAANDAAAAKRGVEALQDAQEQLRVAKAALKVSREHYNRVA
jgi:hypothetical protein